MLGSVFDVSDGAKCGVDDNSTDTASEFLGRDTWILVCQWQGETVSTNLKSTWNSRAKALNKHPVPGKFYRLVFCLCPQFIDIIRFNF